MAANIIPQLLCHHPDPLVYPVGYARPIPPQRPPPPDPPADDDDDQDMAAGAVGGAPASPQKTAPDAPPQSLPPDWYAPKKKGDLSDDEHTLDVSIPDSIPQAEPTQKAISPFDSPKLTVLINSRGGDIHAVLAIYDVLYSVAQWKTDFITACLGSAEGLASLLLVCGKKRYAAQGSTITIDPHLYNVVSVAVCCWWIESDKIYTC